VIEPDAPADGPIAAGPTDEAPVADAAAVNDDAPLAAAAAARAAMLAGAKRPPLKFTTKAAKGVQRGKIGYRQVRVSAGPDDVRTAEVGRVDRNDEVELIGEDEAFFQVRTPEGVEGWVPRYVIRGFTTSTGK
jgi:SH3-like domain-containing protein